MKELINTKQQALKLLEELKQHDFFCFDAETDGLEGRVAGISITYSTRKGWYVAINHSTLFDENNVSEKDFTEIFKDFFEDPGNTFLGWNVGYDHRVLRRLGIYIPISSLEDAQLLGWLVDETKTKALKERAKIEKIVKTTTGFKDIVGKDHMSSFVPAEHMAPYAIQDVQLPLKLYNLFIPQVNKRHLLKHYINVEIPFIGVLSNMTYQGIRMNRAQMRQVELHCLDVIKQESQKAFELAGESFNCSSNKQKQYILFQKMDLPILKSTEKGAPSVNKEVLEDLEAMGNPIATHLLKYSQYKKLYDAFTTKLVRMLDHNDRIHGSFNQTGTITGRLSSSNPNLQQIPRDPEIRCAFVPDPGKVFVMADYSQLELRVLAHFSKDPVMLEAFKNGLDLHSVTAKALFKLECPVADIEEAYKEERRISKVANFGIVYGMGPRERLGVTSEHLNKYFTTHIGAKFYIDAHKNFVRHSGYTQTLSGRFRTDKRVFDNDRYIQGKGFRSLFSAHIQGSASDLIKWAMVNMCPDIHKFKGANIIQQVHDEIIIECLEKDAEDIAEILQHHLENVYPLRVPLVAKPVIGTSWADKK